MKKNYISPELQVENIETVNCLCLSLMSGNADNSDVLTKERTTVDFSQDNNFDF